MTVTTSKGKTAQVEWIWGPLRGTKELMLQLQDDRRLSKIAAEYEGLDEIRAQESPAAGAPVTLYTGYTELKAIVRNGADVQITLAQAT